MILLSLQHVSREFSGLRAVDNVSLELEQEEILGLVGPNGSGKTTLVNLISGVYTPSEGSITFRGATLLNRSRASIVQLGISRSFQAPRLFEQLTARDHIQLAVSGGSPQGLSGLVQSVFYDRDSRGKAEEILEVVGLASASGIAAMDLPYGQQRLLELGRCLASNPSLLLLDEPTAGLNDTESLSLAALLKRLVRTLRLSLVVIDHNVPFVRDLCPRLAVMHRGSLIGDGDSAEVLNSAEVAQAYLGEES